MQKLMVQFGCSEVIKKEMPFAVDPGYHGRTEHIHGRQSLIWWIRSC